MSRFARVTIDPSQFPDRVRLDLLESLRARRVNHKFHYDSVKQTLKWLALHQACSPARTDPNCLQVYEQTFKDTAQTLGAGPVHVIGLGCGGGQKDTALLRQLRQSGRALSYTACDVSVPMVLVARKAALTELDESHCSALVCDLATAQDLAGILEASAEGFSKRQTTRLFTFFGMLPNFEPDAILPKIAQALGPNDVLLLSANLAPGANYFHGVETVLPLYDNSLTREWLLVFLLDLGVERTDGQLHFNIEETVKPISLLRIVANFKFNRPRKIQMDSEQFEFKSGEEIRLFFSYRHTPELLKRLLAQYGLEIVTQWITASGEEGVFRVRSPQA